MTHANEVILSREIHAKPVASDFAVQPVSLADINDGEVLVRIIYLSLDPYVGSALRGRHMTPQPQPGDVVPGYGLGQVIASKADGFAVGDYVAGETGWRDHAIVPALAMRKVDPTAAPLSTQIGATGMPGLTAYASMNHLAAVQPGDHVLVSSAAGPVGGTCGQIARILGATNVVGIAGSDEKCALVRDEYGFDACINYKNADWKEQLAAVLPQGINVYHDNVGGELLDTALLNLADYGRVVLCGLASQYHADERPAGPNPGIFIVKRAKVMGLVVYDFLDEQQDVTAKIGEWIAEGKLHFVEDRVTGLDQAPVLFEKLMLGENIGKAIVAVAAESV
ncbi:MAG: NADP-dependent oxidoreductase [Parasphingorhabdus sp.]|uniref:NADP-dependent oxidoreductase n=1 Tax=Parasphingorhabdus sp. TaxID=2709688 RepID=UPI00329A5E7D